MSPTLDSLYVSNPTPFFKSSRAAVSDLNGRRIEVQAADPFSGTPVSITGRYDTNKVKLNKNQGRVIGEAILKESGNGSRLKPEHHFNIEVRTGGVYVDGVNYSPTTAPEYWASEADYYDSRAAEAAKTAARWRAIADATKKADAKLGNAREAVCTELGFTPYNTLASSTRKAVDRIVELKNK